MPSRILFALLLVAAPLAADAADPSTPWQEFGGVSYSLYPIPGGVSVTWADDGSSRPEGAPLQGPSSLTVDVDGHRVLLLQERQLGAPRLRTEEYQSTTELDADTTRAVARALALRPGVATASPLWTLNPNDHVAPWAATDRVLVRLRSGAAADERALVDAAEGLGLVDLQRRGLAPDQWVARVGHGVDPVAASMALSELPATLWAEVDWFVPKDQRYTPDDDDYGLQWHHENTGQSGGTPGEDMNTAQAWDVTLGDPSVIVSAQDNGVDTDHEDLAEDIAVNAGEIANNGIDDDNNGYVDDVLGWDFPNDDNDPNGSSHGTSVAGTMGAPNNGIGVVGGCPDCLILAVRMLGASNSGEADAHDYSVQRGAAVINNSWGPSDTADPNTPQPIPNVVATAVEYATLNGRNGKGTLIFWAAGNGNNNGQTCSQDGYVSHPDTVAVGASTNFGTRSNFSESCPEMTISAPSSGGSTGISTTSNNDGYVNSFGGTSAASPNAASVGALLMSAAPDLTAAEVRTLLESTAQKIDTAGGNYDANGFSEIYGWGRVDAEAALQGQVAVLSVPGDTVRCDASVPVSVAIPLGEAEPPVVVTATSTSEPGGEVIALQNDGSGTWTGVIQLTDAPAAADGLLSVSDEDVVTVVSLDAESQRSFGLDCVGPVLSDFDVSDIGPTSAVLTWMTDEPADGAVSWEGGGGTDDVLDLDHIVVALDLEPCTTYTATFTSADASGQSSTVADALAWRTPGDPTVVPEDAPDDADPCDPSTWTEPTPDPGDDDDATDDPRSGFAGNGGGCSGCVNSVGGSGSAGLWLLPLLVLMRRRRR